MLRCFVNIAQTSGKTPYQDWSLHITIIQAQRKKHTPFFVAYEKRPFSSADRLLTDSSSLPSKTVSRFVEDFQKSASLAKVSIEKLSENKSVS